MLRPSRPCSLVLLAALAVLAGCSGATNEDLFDPPSRASTAVDGPPPSEAPPPLTTPTSPTTRLRIQAGGTRSGVVSVRPSEPSTGDCVFRGDESTCERAFSPGTTVTITAAASGGSQLARWGGACESFAKASCVITLNAPVVDVTATFANRGKH